MITLKEGRKSPFFGVEIGHDAQPPSFHLAFLASLKLDPYPDQRRERGRLLYSAIIHGALLDRSTWDAWISGIERITKRILAWVDIVVIDATSPSGTATRRWYADPVTRALAIRWLDHAPITNRPSRYSANDCLQHYLSTIVPAGSNLQSCIDQLIRWATIHWRLRMPALLVDQMRGTLPTVALSTYNYSRLIGTDHWQASYFDKAVARPSNPPKDWRRPAYEATRKWAANLRQSNPPELTAFAEVMKLWRNGSLGQGQLKAQCIAYLQITHDAYLNPPLNEDSNPARAQLIRWCQWLLEVDRRPYRQGFTPFTVRMRLLSMLEGIFGGQYPTTAAEVSRRSVLVKARAAASAETCKTLRGLIHRAAQDYSSFVGDRLPGEVDPEDEERESELELEAAEAAEFERDFHHFQHSRGPQTVSANLLSSTDYLNAVRCAYEETDSDELALIIMLGFRTGMRLREILGLQTCDVLVRSARRAKARNLKSDDDEIDADAHRPGADDYFEIHLDHNSYRLLKTFQSRRIVPLNLFLTYNERQALKNWLAPRKAKAIKGGKPMLVFGPVGGTSLPDEWAYSRLIHQILWKACEKKLTFSHLRHSFSSYLLLNLLLPSRDSEKLVPRDFRNMVTWDRKWRLQSSLMGKDRLGQSALHAVSQMMGHTGILRTLQSYQHLLDLAAGLYVNRQLTLPHLPQPAFAPLKLTPRHSTDEPEFLGPSAYWHRVAKQLRQLPSFADDLLPLKAPEDAQAKPGNFKYSRIRYARKAKPNSDSGTSKIGWRLLLELVTESSKASEALAQQFGIEPKQLERWRSRYTKVITAAFAPGALPDGLTPPLGHQAEQVAEMIWRKVPDVLEPQDEANIQSFLNSFRSSSYHGVFPTLCAAKSFAGFLRKIGFPGDHIFIAAARAKVIYKYKLDPAGLPPEELHGQTLFRRAEDLEDRAAEKRPDGTPLYEVVLWFRYLKFERDGSGMNFNTRFRLDAYQQRDDEKRTSAGTGLSPARVIAAEKRQQRAEVDAGRTKSTIFGNGNKAYRFSLLLIAIYHDIALKVEFPEKPHSGNMKARERRLERERAQRKG